MLCKCMSDDVHSLFLVLQLVLQAFSLVCPCISLRGYKLEKYNYNDEFFFLSNIMWLFS